MRNLLIILFIFFFLGGFLKKTKLKNPRVGLVLSGGGAKGLAQIGVLKTLDSLGVRVDYIAGTSMGAVVGALCVRLYRKTIRFYYRYRSLTLLISDEVPRESKTFYERKNAEKYALSLPVNNFKIQLPSSISRGQNMY